jgi:hypothetical protein
MTLGTNDKERLRSAHRTATIEFLATTQSKSVAVAANAQTNAHPTPTHLLPPHQSNKKRLGNQTVYIVAAMTILTMQLSFGQEWKLPNTQLPNYNPKGPTIPDPRYQGTMSNEERNRINMQIIEQDMRNYELQKKREKETLNEINRAFGTSINYKFPSHLNNYGAGYYKMAFDTLNNMLTGQRPLSIKKAVYISEWAFFEDGLPYKEFDGAIKYSANLVSLKMKQDKLPNTSLAKNYAIFKFFSDTIKVKMVGAEKRIVTHYPLRYDFEDFYGEKDWTKGMVSKLLKYQTGQCHSMPLLYLIMAEELGSTSYLANAPEHTYIKIPLPNGKYQNLELTNGHMTTDSYVLSSGYIKSEALANKVYVKPLSKKETVAQVVLDLAKGYRNKYGHDEFYLNMVRTALNHQPNNVTGIYMMASYHYWLFQYILEQDPYILKKPKSENPEVWQIIDTVTFYNNKLISLGYEEMPKEVYADWLKSIDKEKEKSKQMITAIQESIWQPRK